MQPEKNKNFYDVVVIGANVPGVFFAIEQKKLGYNVLLVNKYGFPGGYLTESLSLLQIIENEDLFPVLKEWISKMTEEKGFLFRASTTYVFDPESVKISLLKLLKEYEIDLLFHVFPRGMGIEKKQDNKLALWGKEGAIEIRCSYLFDATENFIMNPLFEEGENIPVEYKTNLITTEVMREKLTDLEGYENLFQLSDGRCYIQFPFAPEQKDFYETYAQKKLDKAAKYLKKNNCRIQVVSPQSEVIYDVKQGLHLEMFEEYFGSFTTVIAEPFQPTRIIELTNKFLKLKFT